jgi:hypothetical protein
MLPYLRNFEQEISRVAIESTAGSPVLSCRCVRRATQAGEIGVGENLGMANGIVKHHSL